RFNRGFERGAHAYSTSVQGILRRKAPALVLFAGLLVLTYGLFQSVPGGFVPSQDKQYLIGSAQLPDGATLDRTDEVIERMGEI
ncbi:efflux RND transporter permease subunit, partial [Aeromonas salmonicida]|uniref:efflux RND transporter permease subunit n=1 Tax=Aeromonas salmonicida TaxID=645 RepID=UPI0035A34AE0